MIIDLNAISTVEVQDYLQHAIAPRPVCLASTIHIEGTANLSPFSFFNMFSANPPMLVFSPARRVRDNTTKHTFDNLMQIPEVVVHICDYNMVQQMSLAAGEYARGVDEFEKAGFTKEPATIIRPPMVREAKIKMECRVDEIKPLGNKGGAGNLVICEILRLHIDDSILADNGRIDQRRLDLVARLGGDWYARINARNLFKIVKPTNKPGIGMDKLPPELHRGMVFSKNHLAQLASVAELPALPEKIDFRKHEAAKELLEEGLIQEAWLVLATEKKETKNANSNRI